MMSLTSENPGCHARGTWHSAGKGIVWKICLQLAWAIACYIRTAMPINLILACRPGKADDHPG